jgi:hypothetical protein
VAGHIGETKRDFGIADLEGEQLAAFVKRTRPVACSVAPRPEGRLRRRIVSFLLDPSPKRLAERHGTKPITGRLAQPLLNSNVSLNIKTEIERFAVFRRRGVPISESFVQPANI